MGYQIQAIIWAIYACGSIGGIDGFEIVTRGPNTEAPVIEIGIPTNGFDVLNENETSTDVIGLDDSKEVTDFSNINETSFASLDQDDFGTDVLTTTQDQLKENTTENPIGLDDWDPKNVTGRKYFDGSSGADENRKMENVEVTSNEGEMYPKGGFGASKQTPDGNSTDYQDILTESPEDSKQDNIRDKIESDQKNLEETSNGISWHTIGYVTLGSALAVACGCVLGLLCLRSRENLLHKEALYEKDEIITLEHGRVQAISQSYDGLKYDFQNFETQMVSRMDSQHATLNRKPRLANRWSNLNMESLVHVPIQLQTFKPVKLESEVEDEIFYDAEETMMKIEVHQELN